MVVFSCENLCRFSFWDLNTVFKVISNFNFMMNLIKINFVCQGKYVWESDLNCFNNQYIMTLTYQILKMNWYLFYYFSTIKVYKSKKMSNTT
jgi:hypothetical protein